MYDNDIEYATRRLRKTMVNFEGKVYYVSEIDHAGTVYLTTKRGDLLEVPLKNFDAKPINLGYIQSGKSWVWAFRMPLRNEWKQGNTQLNTKYLENGNPQVGRDLGGLFDISLLSVPQERLYNSREHCLCYGGAFSRNFCVSNKDLFYKAERVGKVVDGVSITFDKRFEYLRRRLEKTQ